MAICKKQLLQFVCVIASLMVSAHISAQVKIPLKLKPYIKVNKIPAGVKLPPVDSLKKRVDPAATAINYSLVEKADNIVAKIKIEGVVKNIGKDAYKSGANQQIVLLYEVIGRQTKLVASKAFQNLAANAEVKVSFVRVWDKSIEFPPNYTLVISYDPDIYLDGNPNNNDLNSINNKMEKTSESIRELW